MAQWLQWFDGRKGHNLQMFKNNQAFLIIIHQQYKPA